MEFPTIWNMGQKTHTFGSDSRFILYGWVFPPSDESGDHNLISDLHERRNTDKTDNTNDNINPHTHDADINKYVLFAGFPWNTTPPDLKIPFLLVQI